MNPKRLGKAARLVVSVTLLLGLARLLDASEVVSRLGQMQVTWVVLAVAISVLQVGASAWRWRFTAGKLGIDLPFLDALREYYLATFLNQVLPGGVVGDVSRAWRHAHLQVHQGAVGPSVRAVILERTSGQAVMTTVAVVSFLSLPISLGTGVWSVIVGAGLLAAAAVWALLIWVRRRSLSRDSLTGRVWRDVHTALFSGSALPVQIASSVLVVGSYVATYLVAARAVGVNTPLLTLLPLVAPVLMTMLIPITVAGWGVREGAAAALWGAVGLTAVEGVVISVAYGLLVLLSSLPGGLMVLVWRHPLGVASRIQRRSRSNRISSPR